MRLVSRKIWRAFPELDQYDDQVCRNYVRHAQRLSNIWKGVMLTLLSIIIAFIVWIIVAYSLSDLIEERMTSARGNLSVLFWDLVSLVFLTGFLWFPILAAFIVRDFWLRHSVLTQLKATDCAGCGYQLIGLTVQENDGVKFVTCPECGNQTKLNTGHISEADIDPKQLAAS